MNIDQDDMLALIQMAQANLTKITNAFVAEVENNETDHQAIDDLLKSVKTPKTEPGMMTPEQAQSVLKQRAG